MSIPVLGTFDEGVLEAGLRPPEPGERCVLCNRRRNKTRKEDSPTTREVRLRGPADVVEDTEEHLDILQEYVGIDPYSYPRLKLVSALLALGARHREELREHFDLESEEAP